MNRKLTFAAVIGAAALLSACSVIPRGGPIGNRAVPEPTKPVDLARYMGRWYEQFRYDASFQKNMDFVSADYSLQDDGSVKVVNQGRTGGPDAKLKQSVGKAKLADGETEDSPKLRVSFFGPFYGNYWVLDRADDYSWSIVGEPSGRYLWVLTRDKQVSAELLNQLESRVKTLGYDWSLIRRTQQ